MLIAARNSESGKNRPYAYKVEWLESSGTQWIVLEKNLTAFEIVFLPTAFKNYGAVIGTQNETSPYHPCQLRHSRNINSADVALCDNAWRAVSISSTQYNTLAFSRNGTNCKLTLNGTQNVQVTGTIADHPYYIFSANQGNDAASFMNGNFRVKSCSYTGPSGEHLLVPVVDLEGTPCMYDKITNTNLHNAGSGNFVAGPKV